MVSYGKSKLSGISLIIFIKSLCVICYFLPPSTDIVTVYLQIFLILAGNES